MYEYIMASYYDFVLGLIPLSLAGLTALFLVTGLSMSLSVPLASTVAVGLMGHAMFVRAPVSAPTPDHAADAPAGAGHQLAD